MFDTNKFSALRVELRHYNALLGRYNVLRIWGSSGTKTLTGMSHRT